MRATWVLPSRVSSTPCDPSQAPDWAHGYGVTGSRVVPTTTIGGAPGACTECGSRVGSAGHTAHTIPPHTRIGPNTGATLAAPAAWVASAPASRGTGWSRQLIAFDASALIVAPGVRPSYASASERIGPPSPRSAAASADARLPRRDGLYNRLRIARYSSSGPACLPPPAGNGCARNRSNSASNAPVGSPDGRQPQPGTHARKNPASASSKVRASSTCRSYIERAGSMAPSSASARTWVGNRSAYVAPSSVPYDRPTYVNCASPSARRSWSRSRATSTLPTWPSSGPACAAHARA